MRERCEFDGSYFKVIIKVRLNNIDHYILPNKITFSYSLYLNITIYIFADL